MNCFLEQPYRPFLDPASSHFLGLFTQRAALLAAEEQGTGSSGLDGVAPTPAGQVAVRPPAAAPNIVDEFTPISYNYAFFHLIFALASMYIAMLMTGWGSQVGIVGPHMMPKGRDEMSLPTIVHPSSTWSPHGLSADKPKYPLFIPQAQDQDRIDIGWASVWVKTAAQWVTSILYCWTLVAPAIFPGE